MTNKSYLFSNDVLGLTKSGVSKEYRWVLYVIVFDKIYIICIRMCFILANCWKSSEFAHFIAFESLYITIQPILPQIST